MARLASIPAAPQRPLMIGISQCLTGDRVRYDGSEASSSLPHELLAGLFEYRSFCPEVGIGMSVPRDPVHLVGTADNHRVIGVKDHNVDITDELIDYAYLQLPHIDELMGYIFMHHSPSCGLRDVKLYAAVGGLAQRQATGAYAAVIAKERPHLPVQDANWLFHLKQRESFVLATLIYAHWQLLWPDIDAARLLAFHELYRLRLQALNLVVYQQVERVLQKLSHDIPMVADKYFVVLMAGLNRTVGSP
jgi:uncharacterized protein YbbK (DUF523 family)